MQSTCRLLPRVDDGEIPEAALSLLMLSEVGLPTLAIASMSSSPVLPGKNPWYGSLMSFCISHFYILCRFELVLELVPRFLITSLQ